MRTRKVFLIGPAVLAVLLGAVAVQAQPKAADPALRVSGNSIDVRVVNVEVVVTDRRGRRVKDLKPGDFRLKVDGKPVSVEYFTEVEDGRAVAPDAAGEVATPLPGVEPGEPIGTNYLVFIDGLFPIQQHRNVVLAAMKKSLHQLAPGDRMSIVAWDGGRLVRLCGWTDSREQLAQTLDLAARMPAHGIENQVALQRLLSDMKDQRPQDEDPDFAGNDALARILGPGPGMAMAEIAYARTLGYQIAGASRAVISAMRGSSSPAGRKVLLLLAGGWPFSLESYVRGNKAISISRELPENQPALKELSDAANLLGYTIYPVDVPGMSSVTGGSIAENPLEGRGSFIQGSLSYQGKLDTGSSSATPLPATYTRTDSFREQETEGTLYYLAKETGGKPLLNGNREIALDGASADTRSYYWLGFEPEWQRDGKSHKVSVEMTQRGLRARSRQGFLDLTRGAEAGMKVESALLFGELPDGAPLDLHLGDLARSSSQRGAFEFPLTVDIPAEAVTALPSGDGKYTANAQLRLVATDDRGNQSTLPIVLVKLSSEKPPTAGTKLRYSTKVFLYGQATQLVAAVYDPVTGNVAVGKAKIPLP